MVRHNGIGKRGFLWSPPGGEPKFSEDLESALKREFFEETGLLVEIEAFLFPFEYIDSPFHAIELFFLVHRKGGKLIRGIEPEIPNDNIIFEAKFLSYSTIQKMEEAKLHGLFKKINSLNEIRAINTYLKDIN